MSDSRSTSSRRSSAPQVERDHAGEARRAPAPRRPPRWCRRRTGTTATRSRAQTSSTALHLLGGAGREHRVRGAQPLARAQPHQVRIAAPGGVLHARLAVLAEPAVAEGGRERVARALAGSAGSGSRTSSSATGARSASPGSAPISSRRKASAASGSGARRARPRPSPTSARLARLLCGPSSSSRPSRAPCTCRRAAHPELERSEAGPAARALHAARLHARAAARRDGARSPWRTPPAGARTGSRPSSWRHTSRCGSSASTRV